MNLQLINLLYSLLSIVVGGATNAFSQGNLSWYRKIFFFVQAVAAILLIGQVNTLLNTGKTTQYNHVSFLILVCVFIVMSIVSLWGAWDKTNNTADSRMQLLDTISDEVEQYLKDSLHLQSIIALPWTNEPKQVGIKQPSVVSSDSQNLLIKFCSMILTQLERAKQVFTQEEIASDENIINIFNRKDVGRKLLILGNPGSGKTTNLFALAKDLIAEAKDKSDNPVPVIFELSSWSRERQEIAKWLVSELQLKYKIHPEKGKKMLKYGKIIPLLDGLDELEDTQINYCVEKINEFIVTSSSSIIVCSRWNEYVKNSKILDQLKWAIRLQPLSQERINSYLEDINKQNLWQSISKDSQWLQIAELPFFLTVMALVYEQVPPIKEFRFSCAEEQYNHYIEYVLGDYVKYMLETSNQSHVYKTDKVKKWLAFLAAQLEENHQIEFLIERMQPEYLGSFKLQNFYRLIVGTVTGLVTIIWLWYAARDIGTAIIAMAGVSAGFLSLLKRKIEPFETLALSWRSILKELKDKLYHPFKVCLLIDITTLLCVEIYSLLANWSDTDRRITIFIIINLAYIQLIMAVMIALISATGFGLKGRNIPVERVEYANQGIIQSMMYTLCVTFIGGATIALFLACVDWINNIQNYWLWLATGFNRKLPVHEIGDLLITGFKFGLIAGIIPSIALIQHLTVRSLLCFLKKSIPWRYAHFLNSACKMKLMYKVGGRYRFIHKSLQEHLSRRR